MVSKIVWSMAILRMISGSVELGAALLMLRFNQVEKALLINTALALVGPMILISTTTIGLAGIAGKFSLDKFLWILIGVSCIFFAIIKK